MTASSTERQAVQRAEVFIDASPARVYAIISDVTRTGEWSPECRRCRWVGGASGPAVGARFRGCKRYRWLRWSRLNEVQLVDPARSPRSSPGSRRAFCAASASIRGWNNWLLVWKKPHGVSVEVDVSGEGSP